MQSTDSVHLAIVVVNYKTPDLVTNAVDTLLPQIDKERDKVVIVDNASGGHSIRILSDWIADRKLQTVVNLLEAEGNGGFSSGNNIGIKYVDAEFYLLLNSDTLLKENAIEEMLHAAQDKAVGMVAPTLSDGEGQQHVSTFRNHSPISEFLSVARIGIIDQIFGRYLVPINTDELNDFGELEIEWVTFACVLIRSDVIQQIGYLDDGYFMYFEDAEFGFRARNHGWRIAFSQNANVIHLRGGSSDLKKRQLRNSRLPRYYYASRTRYFYQTKGFLGLLSANLMWSMGASVAKLRQWLGSGNHELVAFAWRDIWINILHPLKKPVSSPVTVNISTIGSSGNE